MATVAASALPGASSALADAGVLVGELGARDQRAEERRQRPVLAEERPSALQTCVPPWQLPSSFEPIGPE